MPFLLKLSSFWVQRKIREGFTTPAMVISYCVLLDGYFVPYKGLQGKAGGAAPTLDEQG